MNKADIVLLGLHVSQFWHNIAIHNQIEEEMIRNKFVLPVLLCAFLPGKTLMAQTKPAGFDVSMMDPNVRAQDDFFRFVNGGWIKQNPIPPAEARWGNFNILAEQNLETQRNILEQAAEQFKKQQGPNGSNINQLVPIEQAASTKLGQYYNEAMDEPKLIAQNHTKVLPLLKRIDDIKGDKALALTIAAMHQSGIGMFFSSFVGIDVKRNEHYIVSLSQGGLNMPDKDYYLNTADKFEQIRKAYVQYIIKMHLQFGYSKKEAEQAAKDILLLETRAARGTRSKTDNRIAEKRYNKFSLADFSAKYPAFDWQTYFSALGIAPQFLDSIIVGQPEYFDHIQAIFKENNLNLLKKYMRWEVMNSSASYLSDAYYNLSFDFFGKTIQGLKEPKPRWKRVIGNVNGDIGELLAQEYVKVAFTHEAKNQVNEMVDNLRDAFAIRIRSLDWMSSETKQKALEKLESFNRKLGYPDEWKDYSALQLGSGSFWENHLAAARFAHQRMIARLGTTVNRNEWNMLPQTVNAYYSSVMNEIVFPAAIMQPPFFDANVDAAVNYGAIGAVIGHEFSHGFDDQGSKYDAKGNLNSWWTDDDRKRFEERTAKLVDQFNKFQPLDGVFINGKLTLGENIADLAGLTVAYEAYQLYLSKHKQETIEGFTPEQRFFIGFAQVWRGHSRPEYVRNQVLTDPHSPQEFRVIGTLSNMPEFFKAFDVKKGDRMWRDEADRAKIW